MANQHHSLIEADNAWIIHREEIDTIADGCCNVYMLLHPESGFCFAVRAVLEAPSPTEMHILFEEAKDKYGNWPKQILIASSEPYLTDFENYCQKLKLPLLIISSKEMQAFTHSVSQSFKQTMKHKQPDPMEPQPIIDPDDEAAADALIPETYGPCPCASGKKFKFCCKHIFNDIVFAMAAAEEGDIKEALLYMKKAEEKAGETAEVLCRYAIVWSFFDEEKYAECLNKAKEKYPDHPRLNYILGIDAVAEDKNELAIIYYQKAIQNYPENDKFHLNETYNNLGSAYYRLGQYQQAKEAWEKGLMYLPIDKMTKRNLISYIYMNPDVPDELKEISPFIARFFE